MSDADSLGMVKAARTAGKRITAETCTHYLMFAAEEIPDGNTLYKCAPPIREGENRDRLWKVRFIPLFWGSVVDDPSAQNRLFMRTFHAGKGRVPWDRVV